MAEGNLRDKALGDPVAKDAPAASEDGLDLSSDVDSHFDSGPPNSITGFLGLHWKDLTKRIGYRAFRLSGELFSLLALLGFLFLYSTAYLATRQEADLTALRPNLKQWFSQTFEGAGAEMGEIDLRWLPARDAVEFTARDVAVMDQEGGLLQSLPLLKVRVDARSALARKPDIQSVEIEGGAVTWLQRLDGSLIAGLGTPATVGNFGPSYRGQTNTAPSSGYDFLESFETLKIRSSEAYYVNEINDMSLSFDVSEFEVDRSGDEIEMRLSASSGEAAEAIDIMVRSPDALQTFEVEASADRVRPKDIAPTKGRLEFLSAIDAPISLIGAATYSRVDGLEAADLDLKVDRGVVRLAGEDRDVRSAQFKASLDPGEEVMQVETIALDTARLGLNGSGVLKQLGRINDGDIGTSPTFDLDLRRLTLDARPTFDDALSLTAIKAVGELDLDARTLDLERFEASLDDVRFKARAGVQTADEGLSNLTLIGATEGTLTPKQLLSLWPVKFADGARRWIDRSVIGGQIDSLRYSVNLDEGFFNVPTLTPERIQLEFDVSQGDVRYIQTMSPVRDASGRGVVNGNAFQFVMDQGRIDDVNLRGGTVSIPRLTPKGGDILIETIASAPVPSLMALIDQPPFEYLKRYGVAPDGFSGDGEIKLSIKRPLLEFFDPDRIEYSINGQFTNASAPFQFGPHSLSGADVLVTGGKTGLFVKGPANIGPWRADIEWAETFNDPSDPTRYRVTGVMDRRTLDALGLGFREAIGGTIAVDLRAEGQGLQIDRGTVSADLLQTEIALGEAWRKPMGEAGRVSADLSRQGGGLSVQNLVATAPGLEMRGRAAFRDDFALIESQLDTVRILGAINGQVDLRPNDEGTGFVVKASGPFIDLSSLVERTLATQSSEGFIPVDLLAAFETVQLDPAFSVTDATISLSHNGEAMQAFDFEAIQGDQPLRAVLTTDADSIRRARIDVPDVSVAASAFFDIQDLEGGALTLEADLPAAGEEGATRGSITIEDFRLKRAPFLAQILSLGSLTGLFDTLSGEGLDFDRFETEFGLRRGRLSVRDGRLYGPALGMTGAGEIQLDQRVLEIDGTLVPAYTANSLLGDVPLIGDIFVGKKGEGIFALTYQLVGPYDEVQIGINPLSALTPGFLRGIFKKDRDDLPDRVIADIEEVRPDADRQDDAPEKTDAP